MVILASSSSKIASVLGQGIANFPELKRLVKEFNI